MKTSTSASLLVAFSCLLLPALGCPRRRQTQCQDQILRVTSGLKITFCQDIRAVNDSQVSFDDCTTTLGRRCSESYLDATICDPLAWIMDNTPVNQTCSQCEGIMEKFLDCDTLGFETEQALWDCQAADYFGQKPLLATKACFHLAYLCPDVSCQQCSYCPGCSPGGSGWNTEEDGTQQSNSTMDK